MSDENQVHVPPSFIDLFVPPGRHRPIESREHIAQRHELCEDLAQLLTDHATTLLFQLGVTEQDVLVRVHRGLLGPDAVVSPIEAWWVAQRLAELLQWPGLDEGTRPEPGQPA